MQHVGCSASSVKVLDNCITTSERERCSTGLLEINNMLTLCECVCVCVLSHMFIAKNRSQSAQHNRFNSLHISSAARYKLGSILLTPRPKKKHPYVAAKLRARRCACPARCISILIILSETNKWQETPNIDKTSTLDGGRKVWRFGVRTFAASVRTLHFGGKTTTGGDSASATLLRYVS